MHTPERRKNGKNWSMVTCPKTASVFFWKPPKNRHQKSICKTARAFFIFVRIADPHLRPEFYVALAVCETERDIESRERESVAFSWIAWATIRKGNNDNLFPSWAIKLQTKKKKKKCKLKEAEKPDSFKARFKTRALWLRWLWRLISMGFLGLFGN